MEIKFKLSRRQIPYFYSIFLSCQRILPLLFRNLFGSTKLLLLLLPSTSIPGKCVTFAVFGSCFNDSIGIELWANGSIFELKGFQTFGMLFVLSKKASLKTFQGTTKLGRPAIHHTCQIFTLCNYFPLDFMLLYKSPQQNSVVKV